MSMTIIIIIICSVVAVVIIGLLMLGIKIIPQASVFVVERFGSYKKTLKNGVHWIIPFFDKISLKESLKERVLDFPAQDVITKDNVTMKIDTVVYMQITDAKLYAYGVERPIFAVENLTATTLRNLVGDLELDQTLTSRDTINEKLRISLDDATDPWGIKVLRVELKNILPPEDIRRAMEKQMRAEREKREKVLVAEGTKISDVLKAEGTKAANILRAEGDKAAAILKAEGVKQSVELINASMPTNEAIKLKSFDALVEVSKGDSTTILLPSDLTDVSTLATTFGTVLGKTSKPKTSHTKKNLKEIIEEVKEKEEK